MWWKGGVDETLDRWNNAINYRKLNKINFEQLIMTWSRNWLFCGICIHGFCFLLVMRKAWIHSWQCLLNHGRLSLNASFVVWLLPHRGIDGCLSSYGNHVGDKEGAIVEENMIKLNSKYAELGCKKFSFDFICSVKIDYILENNNILLRYVFL
jgi:hypothetical protein